MSRKIIVDILQRCKEIC